MTPELEALARRAVACPRWRWMPGMLVTGRGWFQSARICDVDCYGIPDLWEYRGYLCGPASAHRASDVSAWTHDDAFPDLTDPATLGCILALVREAHGPSTVVRLVGVNGRGGQEWAISDRAPAVHGWHMAAPALGYWESEVEALVAALENGGGGA